MDVDGSVETTFHSFEPVKDFYEYIAMHCTQSSIIKQSISSHATTNRNDLVTTAR